MRKFSAAVLALSAAIGMASPRVHAQVAPQTSADVVVYEGTPAGVMAAVAASRAGKSVVLVELNNHVGGVVSGGLVETDMGDRNTVGGLSKEFFERIMKYYVDKYGKDSDQVKRSRDAIVYEPHVAEAVFDQMLAEQHVTVVKKERVKTVQCAPDGDIQSFTTEHPDGTAGHTYTGKIFIDASYEGDLMAYAKTKYTFGREGRDQYGEYLAGIGVGPDRGKADSKTMSYNYRVSITWVKDNAVPFYKPDDYDPAPWASTYGERIKKQNLTQMIQIFASGPNRAGPNYKLDTNWFDQAGSSDGYPDGDWKTRDALAAKCRNFAQSLLYYLQTDPSLPAAFHVDMTNWGYPKDEFTDNKNFPFQFYVREARRMVGQYVLTEHDITQNRYKADGIAEGSYGVDCHIIQFIDVNGKRTPDTTHHTLIAGYDIPYACLVPGKTPGQAKNLLVPVCCSASHVAYCSLRMEPVYMMLGQAAGEGAAVALSDKCAVQDVNVKMLRQRLIKNGAILDSNFQPQVQITFSPEHPAVGQKVSFKVAQGDSPKPIKELDWDLKGNGELTGNGGTAEMTYAVAKTYNVSLIAVDDAGNRKIVTAEVPVGDGAAKDVTMDETDADMVGHWEGSYPYQTLKSKDRLADVWIGPGMHYLAPHKGKVADGSIAFTATLAKAGRYQVCIAYRPEKGQSSSVPVTITSASGTAKVVLDESKSPTPFPFVPVGEYRFDAGGKASVELSNDGTEGRVTVDGVRWVWLGE